MALEGSDMLLEKVVVYDDANGPSSDPPKFCLYAKTGSGLKTLLMAAMICASDVILNVMMLVVAGVIDSALASVPIASASKAPRKHLERIL